MLRLEEITTFARATREKNLDIAEMLMREEYFMKSSVLFPELLMG
jgi:hypothetical protein